MKNEEIVHFYTSEEVFDKANEIFVREKAEIEKFLDNVDIQHVGSCAIPGALAKFDVDIQIRIGEADFESAVSALSEKYNPKHPELWKKELALFETGKECKVDVLLTVIDSKYDDYYRVRDFLIENPDVLDEYNQLKRLHEGKPYSEYRKAKGEFLGRNGDVNFLKSL